MMVNVTLHIKKQEVQITRPRETLCKPFFRPVRHSTSNSPKYELLYWGNLYVGFCPWLYSSMYSAVCMQLNNMLFEYLWVFKVLCSQIFDCKKRLLSSKTFHLIDSFFCCSNLMLSFRPSFPIYISVHSLFHWHLIMVTCSRSVAFYS